jgi:hypothetical protein
MNEPWRTGWRWRLLCRLDRGGCGCFVVLAILAALIVGVVLGVLV